MRRLRREDTAVDVAEVELGLPPGGVGPPATARGVPRADTSHDSLQDELPRGVGGHEGRGHARLGLPRDEPGQLGRSHRSTLRPEPDLDLPEDVGALLGLPGRGRCRRGA